MGVRTVAQKIKNRTKKHTVPELPDNMLPQNILPIGDHVEENKNIYISQKVYKEIQKFTKDKTTNESGGMLVGSIIEEFGKTNIVISGFVEAKHCEATPTTIKFTHETWDYVHKEIEKKFNGTKIVGWIHTHPDFGIFLSEYDKFIQKNFFNEEYQIAYVVDPIQQIEGFYFWINNNIERCKGFYIYDKTGVEINVGIEKEDDSMPKKNPLSIAKNALITALSIMVVFLIFSNISTNNTLKELEEQQETLANSANQSLAYMQQLIFSQATEIEGLNSQIAELNNILRDAGIISEPANEEQNDPTATDTNQEVQNDNTGVAMDEDSVEKTGEQVTEEPMVNSEVANDSSSETTDDGGTKSE